MSWYQDDVWVNAEQYFISAGAIRAPRTLGVARLAEGPPESNGNCGLVHGDLCAANFVVDGDPVTMFDFDDSCYHWFIYDLVCAVAPATFRPAEERHPLRDAIVEGYVKAHPLPKGWEALFGRFLRMRGLYLFILHQRNWHGDPADNPKRALVDRLRICFDEPAIW
jgi:Ser/Thr protein kinase RdoA (MazF antagonist)